eukprot:672299-Prymnesium_polylepis.2
MSGRPLPSVSDHSSNDKAAQKGGHPPSQMPSAVSRGSTVVSWPEINDIFAPPLPDARSSESRSRPSVVPIERRETSSQ